MPNSRQHPVRRLFQATVLLAATCLSGMGQEIKPETPSGSTIGTPETFITGVPDRQLTWATDGEVESAKLTPIAVAVNNQGHLVRRVTEEITAHRPLSRSAEEPASSLARAQITLLSSPDIVRSCFVVRGDADGKIGSFDLPVPGAPPPPNQNASSSMTDRRRSSLRRKPIASQAP